MANNTSGKSMVTAMAAIVVVVLGLGIAAISPKVSENISENRKSAAQEAQYNEMMAVSGRIMQKTSNIAEMADVSGMETDEFIKKFGLEDSEFNGDTEQTEFDAKTTLSKYVEFYNGSAPTDAEWTEFKSAKGVADDVTADTKDEAVKADYLAYLAEKKAAEEAAAAEAEAAQNAETNAEENTGAIEVTGEATEESAEQTEE